MNRYARALTVSVALALLGLSCEPSGRGRRSGADTVGVAVPPADGSGDDGVPVGDDVLDRRRTEADATQAGAGTQVLSAPCDKVYVYKVTSAGGYNLTRSYYAELVVPGLDPKSPPHITAVECGLKVTGQSCPEGSTCEASGDVDIWAPADDACRQTSYVLRPGRIWVSCGNDSEVDYGVPDGWSNRATSVAVRISE